MLSKEELQRLGDLAATLRSQMNELLTAIERVRSESAGPRGERHNPDLDAFFGEPARPPAPEPSWPSPVDDGKISISEILGKKRVMGIEPTTNGLENHHSTTELHPHSSSGGSAVSK